MLYSKVITIMGQISSFYRKNVDVLFADLAIIFSTLSMRKIIGYDPESFNEYTALYVNIADIVVWIAIGIVLLCNRLQILSTIRDTYSACRELVIVGGIFMIWMFLSSFWSSDFLLSLFRFFQFLTTCAFLIYLFLRFQLFHVEQLNTNSALNFIKYRIWIFLCVVFVHSIVGLYQFIEKKSVGLSILRETVIGTDLPGIAKIEAFGDVFVRAYGLFPHPNVFAGYLLMAIIVLAAMPNKMFHVEQWKYARSITVIFFSAALIATGSKSAIAGIMIYGVFRLLNNIQLSNFINKNNVPRGTIYAVTSALAIFALGIALYQYQDAKNNITKSIEERSLYQEISYSIVRENFFGGVGNGAFVHNMKNHAETTLKQWQFQPVHNVGLLILSEMGIIAIIIFMTFAIIFTKKLNQNVPRGTIYHVMIVPMSFTVIFTADHYLWDIAQGRYLLMYIIAVMISIYFLLNNGKRKQNLG